MLQGSAHARGHRCRSRAGGVGDCFQRCRSREPKYRDPGKKSDHVLLFSCCSVFSSFFLFLSSGGWGKIKLKLTTLPRIFCFLFFIYICQDYNSALTCVLVFSCSHVVLSEIRAPLLQDSRMWWKGVFASSVCASVLLVLCSFCYFVPFCFLVLSCCRALDSLRVLVLLLSFPYWFLIEINVGTLFTANARRAENSALAAIAPRI